jgi:hypothetical protein
MPAMTCSEFRDRYSDFRDGLMTAPREQRRCERHLALCAECRAYDTRVRRGVLALQASGEIAVSPEFRRRLDSRLRRERLSAALVAGPVRTAGGLAAALFVAAALLLLASEGGHRASVAEARPLPPVAFPKPVARAGIPFVSFQDPRAAVVRGNASPYGSALVEPASASR